MFAHEITISGTRFMLDGHPFPYTGLSFFNAIYNPSFNQSSNERVRWLRKFQKYGVNVLRVWAQWDSKHKFVDTCPDCTLYFPDGRLRSEKCKDSGCAISVVEQAPVVCDGVAHDVRRGPRQGEAAWLVALAC